MDFYLTDERKNSLNATDGKELRTRDPKSLISNFSVWKTKTITLELTLALWAGKYYRVNF